MGIRFLVRLFSPHWVLTFFLMSTSSLWSFHPTVWEFDPDEAGETWTVEGGQLEEGPEGVLRWVPVPGQAASLHLSKDHPLFQSLRYYDVLELEFRVAAGEIDQVGLRALGHVSGPRQYKVHSFTFGRRTTEREVWHRRDVRLDRPFWFPWDEPDGYGEEAFFRLEALALVPGTVIELRGLRLVRAPLFIKPDAEPPVTWPTREDLEDGGVSYTMDVHFLNASSRPFEVSAELVSEHPHFEVTLDAEPQLIRVGQRASVSLTAVLSAEAIEQTEELYSEPLRVRFVPSDDPGASVDWTGRVVRPLSGHVRRQVVVGEETLATTRRLLEESEEFARRLRSGQVLAAAESFLEVDLVDIPRHHHHTRNAYPGAWRPTEVMPEVVHTETGERQFNTPVAAVTWKEHFGHAGTVPEHLGNAYLWTGEERFARHGIELLELFALHYQQLPWNDRMFDVPWYHGSPIQTSSRTNSNSSYGTNMQFKWLSLMISLIAESESWTEEVRQRVYEGYIRPYGTELTKMLSRGLNNQSDITNHNLLLIGLAFDDAHFVWEAVRSDVGIANRLSDIDADGFSSEGRPLNYHFAAMTEYVDSILHLQNSGIEVDLPLERLLEAARMPFLRATLSGRVPNAADCARWQSVHRTSVLGQVAAVFPREDWLVEVGGVRTLSTQVRAYESGLAFDGEAWRRHVTPDPVLFADAGMAILRRGDTEEEQIMLTLDYGESLFHAHRDRNQITLFAFGKTFTHGPGTLYNVGSGGMNRVRDPDLEAFIGNRSLGQNIVLVDASDQSRVIGELVAWDASDPDRQVAVSRVVDGYPGVTHTRGVVLTEGVVLVFDRLEATEERLFDFVYHNFGEWSVGEGWSALPRDEPLATTANYHRIKDLHQLEGEGWLRLHWDLSNQVPEGAEPEATLIGLNLWQAPMEGGEAYVGITGLNNPNTLTVPDGAPSLIRRVRGSGVTYVTVLEPYRESGEVTAVEAVGDEGVRVRFADGRTVEANLADLILEHGVER